MILVELPDALKERLREIGQSLSEREHAVFQARCLGERIKTHAELAKEFGVSSPEIGRLEKRVRYKIDCAVQRDPKTNALFEAEMKKRNLILFRDLFKGSKYPQQKKSSGPSTP